jgi:hypothetical protein
VKSCQNPLVAPLADGPPLIRGFAGPAEPERLCRNLHARALLLSIMRQFIELYDLFTLAGFGLKLVQAKESPIFQRHFWIVCKGVKQSSTWIALSESSRAANPVICRRAKPA